MAFSLRLDSLLAALAAAFGDQTRPDEPLSGHTTSRIGGPADIWLAVGSVAELAEAVALARQHQIPVFSLVSHIANHLERPNTSVSHPVDDEHPPLNNSRRSSGQVRFIQPAMTIASHLTNACDHFSTGQTSNHSRCCSRIHSSDSIGPHKPV